MDSLTKFKTLKGENGKVTGFEISSVGNTEDECFCEMLPKNLYEGKAGFRVADDKIFIKSIGIGEEEEWSFDLSEDEGSQLQIILSGLEETHQAHCKTEGGFGVSFIAIFKEIPPLNKREWGKRKRSFWRNPTPSKNKGKIENWGKIYT